MLEPADVLVLDEPTNDLDIPTLEVLEDAVEGFGGATLLVTHDRAMLDRLASRIVVLGAPDGIPRIVASLPQALRALEEFESLALAAAKVAVPASRTITSAPAAAIDVPNAVAAVAATPKKKLGYSEQRELDGMEKAIAVAEAKSAELSARLNDATLLANHAAYAKACDTAGEAQAAVTRMYARWEELEAKRA
jgi:ATP-binding cassette subfamily F protein uup